MPWFTLDKRSFAYYNVDIADWFVESGIFTVMVGKSSRDIQLTAKVNVEGATPLHPAYTMNTTIGDIMADPKGAAILGQMMQAMTPLAGCRSQRRRG